MTAENHDLGRLEERVTHLVESSARQERLMEEIRESLTYRLNRHGDQIRDVEIRQARLDGMGTGFRWVLAVWGVMVTAANFVMMWFGGSR